MSKSKSAVPASLIREAKRFAYTGELSTDPTSPYHAIHAVRVEPVGGHALVVATDGHALIALEAPGCLVEAAYTVPDLLVEYPDWRKAVPGNRDLDGPVCTVDELLHALRTIIARADAAHAEAVAAWRKAHAETKAAAKAARAEAQALVKQGRDWSARPIYARARALDESAAKLWKEPPVAAPPIVVLHFGATSGALVAPDGARVAQLPGVGRELRVGMNARYLVDVLEVLGDARVTLGNGPLAPVRFDATTRPGFAVVMPFDLDENAKRKGKREEKRTK